MLRFVALIAIVLATASLWAQGYKPAAGETVMKMVVAGRGDVYIRLDTKKAPKTTAHISSLVERKFYDNQKFFKVIKSPKPFLVQFGDPGSKTKKMNDPSLGNGGSGKTIPYENTGRKNVRGAVGLAAKEGDPNSGDSQFYILLGDYAFLEGQYTVFGEVVQGMNIVDNVRLGDKVTSVTIIRGR